MLVDAVASRNPILPDQFSFTAEPVSMTSPNRPFVPSLFRSFWMGGFESSCHINRRRQRLDMIVATQHDRFVDEDYERLLSFGMRTARDTVRWHLIERTPGDYDFSSFDGQIDAARRHRLQIIWDLCHYGWPDDVDVFRPEFVDRFARF